MAVIRVPKPPESAFDKNRPASTLLQSQIQHLEWAVRPASLRKPHQLPKRVKRTEAQAAAYIEQMTRHLHPEGASTPSAPLVVPAATGPKRARAKPARRRRAPSARRSRS